MIGSATPSLTFLGKRMRLRYFYGQTHADPVEFPSDVGDFLAVSVEVSIERKSLEYWSKLIKCGTPSSCPPGN